MKSLLRSSILYACETYYNLKESEVRQLERIEEEFLRELLKTSRGCPLSQLYLEVGLIPAKFEIIKIRLLFLKYILNQKQESMIFRFYQLQSENSVQGDWATMCMENLKELNITESLEEIKLMTQYQFQNMLRKRVSDAAYKYLTGKQGKKGGEIEYKTLEMSDYLSPLCSNLSIDSKRTIFAIRNKMTKIPANFSSENVKHKCFCGENETMKHVYTCTNLNSEKPAIKYEHIYSNNIQKLSEVYKRFEHNMTKRENETNENRNDEKQNETPNNEKNKNNGVSHVIHIRDPLYPV